MQEKYMSIKALIIGIIVTIIICLCGQLAYILLAAYIGNASAEYVLIHDNKQLLWLCLSLGSYAICFLLGGIFTSLLTEKKKVIHAGVVGFVVSLGSVLSAGDFSSLNYKMVIMAVVGFSFSALGGFIGVRRANNPT